MKVLSLKIENLLSIKETYLEFEDSGLVLVEGWNYDDGRANGAGKTAIFNALSFAIYNKIPRKITISEVLRKGTKQGYAEAVVQTDNGVYTVRRERPKKVTFLKDGLPTDITQEEFEHHIKLSYDQFLLSMYIAQGSTVRFLNKNDTDKKNFLLQLMNLNEFSDCKKEADRLVKEYEKQITELQVGIEKAKSKISVYKESLVDPEDIKGKLQQYQREVDQYEKEIKELQQIQKPDISKFIELEKDLNDRLNKLTRIRFMRQAEYDKYHELLQCITPFVPQQPDDNCPYCQGDLKIHGLSVSKADNIEEHRRLHEQQMDQYKKDLAEKKKAIDEYDNRLANEGAIKDLKSKLHEKQGLVTEQYNKAQSQIESLGHSKSARSMDMERYLGQLEVQTQVKSKIDTLNKYIEAANNKISDLSVEVTVYEAISNMYAPTGAPAYIMDSVVDSFNEVATEYISLIWPNATYELKAYKETKKGDVSAKFSESLIIGGKSRSIGSLSGGEFRALSLAVDFAIIDILGQQFGITLNPIIMDEPFEGLDATGREIVIELLDKISIDRQIWVIDHASEAKSMFSSMLRVEKRNGISSLV